MVRMWVGKAGMVLTGLEAVPVMAAAVGDWVSLGAGEGGERGRGSNNASLTSPLVQEVAWRGGGLTGALW